MDSKRDATYIDMGYADSSMLITAAFGDYIMSNPQHATDKRSWRKPHKMLSWSAAAVADLKLAITSVTGSGGAVMFATTQDGGALVLTVFSGQEKFKEYLTDEADIPALLQWVATQYG